MGWVSSGEPTTGAVFSLGAEARGSSSAAKALGSDKAAIIKVTLLGRVGIIYFANGRLTILWAVQIAGITIRDGLTVCGGITEGRQQACCFGDSLTCRTSR